MNQVIFLIAVTQNSDSLKYEYEELTDYWAIFAEAMYKQVNAIIHLNDRNNYIRLLAALVDYQSALDFDMCSDEF